MRKLVIVICLFFAGVAIYANLAPVPNGVTRTVGGVSLPLKIAMLSAKEPESQILMPVRRVSVKRVADTWQAPRSGGRSHQGQDIFAPRGTPVHSATEGYVVRIGENPLGGKTVFVAGAGGRTYYYAHLDSYAPELTTGDYVTHETVLGYVGTTGNAAGTPPHLHFSVYTPTGAVNPLPLLVNKLEEHDAE